MPTELNFITIKQSKFDKQPSIDYCCRLSFKVHIEQIRTVCVEFEDDFIEDYFHIPGNDEEKMQRILNSQEDFLFRLGLIKIEEMINNQSFSKVIRISDKEIDWAKKVEKERIIPSSNEMNGEFQFYPQKRIGF